MELSTYDDRFEPIRKNSHEDHVYALLPTNMNLRNLDLGRKFSATNNSQLGNPHYLDADGSIDYLSSSEQYLTETSRRRGKKFKSSQN